MAVTEIVNTKMVRNEAVAIPATVAVATPADGAAVDFSNQSDGRILVILENANSSAAKTATIQAGDGIQGVADLEISIPASTKEGIVVESGCFVQNKGENKGKILVVAESTDIKVAAIELP